MPTFRPRIAIVGAGPSGIALGQLLYQRGIPVTIYELRAKAKQEELDKPSGMLDLHEESGLTVIRECGLWDGFQTAVGDCSESMRVINRDGVVLHTDEGELAYRPEITRNALTNLLIQNLPSEVIKWDHKITTVRIDRSTGATEIVFDLGVNGTATYDFVVGADGAWSRIRKDLLSDIQPFYSGAQYVTTTMRQVSTKYPHLAELCGSGSLCALGGGNAIMTQCGPQDSIRLYAAMSTPHEHWVTAAGLEGKTAAEVKTMLLGNDKLFRSWAPALQDLLATACDEETKDNPGEVDIKPYYMLPIGYRWEHRPGVTLIGDAAHLMTPWAGEGVNLALWDSLDLAHALSTVPEVVDAVAWQAALEPRIREFEEAMLARSQVAAEKTDRNRSMFLSENGAEAMAGFFKMYEDMAATGGPPQGQQDGSCSQIQGSGQV